MGTMKSFQTDSTVTMPSESKKSDHDDPSGNGLKKKKKKQCHGSKRQYCFFPQDGCHGGPVVATCHTPTPKVSLAPSCLIDIGNFVRMC